MTKQSCMLPLTCDRHTHSGYGTTKDTPCPWCEIERLRALLVQWEGNCTGRHGSQSPCGFTADHVVPADRAQDEPEPKT